MNKETLNELKEKLTEHIIDQTEHTDTSDYFDEIEIEEEVYFVKADVVTREQGEGYMDGHSMSYEIGDYKIMDCEDVDITEITKELKDGDVKVII